MSDDEESKELVGKDAKGRFIAGHKLSAGNAKLMRALFKGYCRQEIAAADIVGMWVEEVRSRGEYRMEASKQLVLYGIGKPDAPDENLMSANGITPETGALVREQLFGVRPKVIEATFEESEGNGREPH